MTDAVHTSAQEGGPDLFESGCQDEVWDVDGVLLADAQVRVRLVGNDQHPVVVLCLELRPLSALIGSRRTIHAEQIFDDAHRKVAEQRAAALKKGMRVRITSPLYDMRTVLPNVQTVVALA